MSEKQNRKIGDLSKYDAMTTEELEEILRLDAQAPQEQESDTEMILYIMEVLADRKQNTCHTEKTALEAYESFKQNYMPEEDNHVISYQESVKAKRGFPRWIRSIAAVAAVVIILVLGSVTAKALGFNLWETVVKWTQETFHFGEWGDNDEHNNLPYASLQEALDQGEITTLLVPNWFPDGYELVDVTVNQMPLKKVYRAKYTKGELFITITIQDYLDKIPVYVEQREGLEEEYKVAGVTYYLFLDNDVAKAVWINGSYECDILGNVTIDELKLMIDSIEKG